MVYALTFAVMILTTAVGLLAAMIFQHRAERHKLRTQISALRASLYLERGTTAARPATLDTEGTRSPRSMSPSVTREVGEVDLDAERLPERLGDLLDLVLDGQIPVPSKEIPSWLRESEVPIGIQKLAALMRRSDAPPDELDPLWIPALMNIFQADLNPTFTQAVNEFNRLAALEAAERSTPVPSSGDSKDACVRMRDAFPRRPFFDALFNEYVAEVFSAVEQCGVPAKDAEEVTQNVLLAICEDFHHWLKTITYRTVRAHLEGRRGKG